jgi:gamma-glutamyltranspeptidase/glutathione hydrolase
MDKDRAEADLDRVEDKAWTARQAAGFRVPTAMPVNTSVATTVSSAAHDWTGSYWGQNSHHTSHFTIADCDGRVVSITQTVGPSFGSRVITPGLGFVYAATMGSYLSAIDQVPGSRPRTTIAPTVVTRDGEVVLALGAAGGMRILSAIVQTISRYVDQGHDPDVAVALPRVHPVQDETDSGEYVIFSEQINFEMTPERGWPPEVAESLRASGFEVVPVEKHASFGRVHLIARSGNAWQGVADADWEGTAMSASCPTR